MLDSLDNGREEKDRRVKGEKENAGNKSEAGPNAGGGFHGGESCRLEEMCPRNASNVQGINLKLGKSCYVEEPQPRTEELEFRPEPWHSPPPSNSSRLTGSSCRALKCAVSTLHRLDDFNMEKIGSGFFSEVFKVTHKVTGKVMVLKMNLLRSNRPNMLKEVQLMNQLKHRNILNFLGVCVHEGQLHALTEYINGGSLEQLIQSWNVELPYLIRQQLALDIARGMEYLHSKGVFHRDLTSKNVLIKKSDGGEMMAVVGDFGLAAKIPDPKSKYRLPTVGSAYWMSPECLKGQWYNEKSDIFSYGIVLCEMIARIEADPDVLPRTDNFGLDYLAFSELCGPCPPHFLKLAFSCSTFEPKSRPSFSEIVKTLERLIPEYEELLGKDSNKQSTIIAASSLDNLINVNSSKSGITARSEEVINKCANAGRDSMYRKKLHHRRSLSEDVVSFLFPRHTAPSDKARCHFMNTTRSSNCEILANPKFIGESMCQADPHYKPRSSGEKGARPNPFLALSHFRGLKKIVGSQNMLLSRDGQGEPEPGGSRPKNGDLFSSCFELPSPFYGTTPPSSPIPGSGFDENWKGAVRCCCFRQGCDLRCGVRGACRTDESASGTKARFSRRLFPVENLEISGKKDNSDLNSSPKSIVYSRHEKMPGTDSNLDRETHSQACGFRIRNMNQKSVTNKTCDFRCDPLRISRQKCSLSVSLPNSPTSQKKLLSRESTFAQREIEKQLGNPSVVGSGEKPKRLAKSITVPLLKKLLPPRRRDPSAGTDSLLKTDVNEKRLESSSFSSGNLPEKIIFQDGGTNGKGGTSCEDGVTASAVSPDAEAELTSLVAGRISSSSTNLLECNGDDSFLVVGNVQLKRRGSCESGFFSCVGEDCVTGNEALPSCDYVLHATRQKHLDNSSATLSSSSAASSLFLLDDSLSTTTVSSLRSGSGDFNDLDELPSKFAHHSILFSGKRSSSVYTDSSEDVSSLGDVDDRNQSRYQSQQISKIVEYFERKQTSGFTGRNENLVKYRRNHNVEFQKNIEKFDSSKASSSDKIKWEGLEGKFRKSGMGLTQMRDVREEISRSKIACDAVNVKSKKLGTQNAAETGIHSDLTKKFDGGAISDAIRKSKIELLRRSLERGSLHIPGLNACPGPGLCAAPGEKPGTRPLATRLMICEGAVKSKLPLFDKK